RRRPAAHRDGHILGGPPPLGPAPPAHGRGRGEGNGGALPRQRPRQGVKPWRRHGDPTSTGCACWQSTSCSCSTSARSSIRRLSTTSATPICPSACSCSAVSSASGTCPSSFCWLCCRPCRLFNRGVLAPW